MRRIAVIRSGGQTGADRAGLDAAVANGVTTVGWVPLGGSAEDLREPPGLISMYDGMRDSGTLDLTVRTRLNVRDSHATLIVFPWEGEMTPGSAMTAGFAEEYGRPLFVSNGDDLDEILDWLSGIGNELTLNIAGPTESKRPGTYDVAYRLIDALLKADSE